jgi:hypothetical protein
MKKAILYLVLSTVSFQLSSQFIERCGYELHKQQRGNLDSEYLVKRALIDQQITNHAVSSVNRSELIYRIPVVFHVIYNNETQNLPDDKILEQLAILNKDFGRLNEDTVNTRSEFLPVAASTGIEFYLAQWDPQGNPTTGITNTQTDQASFFNIQFDLNRMKSASTGGVDAWDVNQYLNIWVCNLSIPFINTPFILGFATPPEGAPNWPSGSSAEQPSYDGVVLHYEVVGENPNATGTFATVNKGRTATHEVGHYLGLRHIWGDAQGQDGCDVDDGIEDTPNCAEAQQQTCDFNSNSCVDSPDDFPDQIENYMDYSDENCMNMFTLQQANAMRFVIENFRQDLILTNKEQNNLSNSIKLFPNPTTDILHWQVLNSANIVFKQIQILSVDGRIVRTFADGSTSINLIDLSPGIYCIKFLSNGFESSLRFLKL